MASNYTEHYQLPLWEPEDSFLREEFNEANRKVDDTLKSVQDMAEATAVDMPRLHFGSYKGDDTATREIQLGFTPKFMLLGTSYGQFSDGNGLRGGLCAAENPCQVNGRVVYEIVDGGFRVYQNSSASISTNYASNTYYYLAIE